MSRKRKRRRRREGGQKWWPSGHNVMNHWLVSRRSKWASPPAHGFEFRRRLKPIPANSITVRSGSNSLRKDANSFLLTPSQCTVVWTCGQFERRKMMHLEQASGCVNEQLGYCRSPDNIILQWVVANWGKMVSRQKDIMGWIEFKPSKVISWFPFHSCHLRSICAVGAAMRQNLGDQDQHVTDCALIR